MKKMDHIAGRIGRFIVATMAFCMAVVLSGCVDEDWTDCAPPTITVTVTTHPGHDQIDAGEVNHVILYIFDNNDKTLLDVIHTEVGEVHELNYPRNGKLHVIAVANCMEQTILRDMQDGTHISAGGIDLITLADDYNGMPHYDACDDLMWGEAYVDNDGKSTQEQVELPIRRIVAGVYITVKGLDNLHYVDLDDVQIALGVKHNSFGLHGEPTWMGSRAVGHNMYVLPATGRHPGDPNMLHAPAVSAAAGNDETFFRILSTDAGDNVAISLFHSDGCIDTAVEDKDGKPLSALNGKLNVFEIEIGNDGQIDVTVSPAKWGETPEIGVIYE